MQRTRFRLEFSGYVETKQPVNDEDLVTALETKAKSLLDDMTGCKVSGQEIAKANADVDIITDPPCLLRVLDISTKHITQADSVWLSEQSGPKTNSMIVREYEYGWWVHVNQDDEGWIKSLREFGYAESLLAVLKFALDHGCHYIFIDRDATEYPGLPIYEW